MFGGCNGAIFRSIQVSLGAANLDLRLEASDVSVFASQVRLYVYSTAS